MQHDRYHRFTSILFGLVSLIALGAAFVFTGMRESENAWVALAICVLTGLMSIIKHQLSLVEAPHPMVRINKGA